MDPIQLDFDKISISVTFTNDNGKMTSMILKLVILTIRRRPALIHAASCRLLQCCKEARTTAISQSNGDVVVQEVTIPWFNRSN